MSKKVYGTLQNLLQENLKDPAFRLEYEKLEPQFMIASILIELRQKKRLTQTTLARMAKLNQSEIAKLESGSRNVTVKTLHKIALATGTKLKIALVD